MPMSVSTSDRRLARLANPALRASLSAFVRARVPGSEVDDIVQSALAEALAAERAPDDDDEVVAWVHGIARHKVVDWFRRARREAPQDPQVTEIAAADSAPQSARDLLRWATRELPTGDENARTFEWMLREGAGEKLEQIAADARVPAPRVRQRVSRLRRHYRARWAATLAALVLIAVAVGLALRKRPKEEIAPLPSPSVAPSAPLLPPLTPVPQATPEERAAELRRDAFEKCAAHLWQDCIDGLDGARRLDPAGDLAPSVQERRAAAQRALAPAPTDKTMPAPTPKSSDTPLPAPAFTSLPAPMKKRPTKPKASNPSDWSSDTSLPSQPSTGAK
jgi:DNA-directed RNA polymerase specialized sigma24 family protein